MLNREFFFYRKPPFMLTNSIAKHFERTERIESQLNYTNYLEIVFLNLIFNRVYRRFQIKRGRTILDVASSRRKPTNPRTRTGGRQLLYILFSPYSRPYTLRNNRKV